MKIIIDDKIPYIQTVLEPYAEVHYIPGKDIAPEDTKDADALIVRTRTKVNENLLEDSSIKFIATATIGYDHIDREYLKNNNIPWTSCPGCNSESVAQYITSTLIRLEEKYSESLKGKTIGIVGAGNVGKKIFKKATALGMKVLVNDPPREEAEGPEGFCSIEKIKAEADFITLHVPLFREGELKTYHLVDTQFLKEMKSNAIIMNTCRGEVINNQDLKVALQNNEIRGAVIDVWENEPAIDPELLELVDIATSHIAGYSADGKSNGTSMSVQALSKHFGLELNEWFPNNVPMPEPVISLTQAGYEGVKEAVLTTFDILTDDKPLRDDISTFEFNRGNYQLRREFHNYSVKNTDELNGPILKGLGFTVL
ncbi:MAG: 4-phosphoerythronate dehydrogenase [Lentisphaeraceae bacterium]|nr:4-phosphoerythronate dehydrogenase [Lentisphaeraceae bacterium]